MIKEKLHAFGTIVYMVLNAVLEHVKVTSACTKKQEHRMRVSTFGCSCFLSQPFPKRQILDSSKLKEFADDNFKFDENGKRSPNGLKTLWE